ncbi:high-affinity nitrate transporter 3.2 [Hibiscus syriacus]|uniref:High-affinity nitrate transporter 3.2 n=1 Tax=Hibiscus syriacus TaxID=106335 RepID=A0A6A3BGZ1_HIBSY|nr:high-affinity nitrate transporter 3.2 [Hibiscus syriacus]
MGCKNKNEVVSHGGSKGLMENEIKESPFTSIPKSLIQSSRPSSMVVKKAHTVIPAHIVAEAISTLHGLDLRWSGPITPTERDYVEQYVLAKYPQYADNDYLVLFTPNYKDSMMLVGESYPFFKGNFYMSIIGEELDYVREFASYKESKIDIGTRNLVGFENQRITTQPIFQEKMNSWHVLLDAAGIVVRQDQLNLTLHRPDFVLCSLENTHAQPSRITCLMVRKKSFDTSTSQISE